MHSDVTYSRDLVAPATDRIFTASSGMKRFGCVLACIIALIFLVPIDPNASFKSALTYWIARPMIGIYVLGLVLLCFPRFMRLEVSEQGFRYVRLWKDNWFNWEDVSEFGIGGRHARKGIMSLSVMSRLGMKLKRTFVEFYVPSRKNKYFRIPDNLNNVGEDLFDLMTRYRELRLDGLAKTDPAFDAGKKSSSYVSEAISPIQALLFVFLPLILFVGAMLFAIALKLLQ